MEGARKVETSREKEYLLPLFEEVLEEARAVYPQKLKNVKIYIIDRLTINARAIGRNTVAITKGALETFSEDELRAVIAHELAHIIHMDTLAQLFVLSGNGVFGLFVMIARAVMVTVTLVQYARKKINVTTIILGLIWAIIETLILLFTFLLQIFIATGNKEHEYRADAFTEKVGYREDMIDALYLLQKVSLGEDSDLSSRMLSNHPRISARIERLELLGEADELAEANFNP